MSARPRLARSDYALVEATLTLHARDVGSGRSRAACPLCERARGKADAKLALYLHADGGWVCFRCGAAGWLPGTGPNGGAHGWAGRIGIDARTRVLDAPAGEIDTWKRPPPGFSELYDEGGMTSRVLQLYRDYIAVRGIDARIGKLARIGACASGELGGHVVVPVFAPVARGGAATDETDEWHGWVARTLWPPPNPYVPIYREPSGAPKGTYFYRGEALAQETRAPVFVVEGVFDAIPMWPDGIAALGKVTGEQFTLLCASRRPVVFIPDGDAWRAGDGLMLALRAAGVDAGCIRLPPRVDPDEIPVGTLRAAGEVALREWTSVPVDVPA